MLGQVASVAACPLCDSFPAAFESGPGAGDSLAHARPFVARFALPERTKLSGMQNAQNLMSSFEFIAALMSIIVGLGVTNLLSGIARALYRRTENPLDEIRIVLSVATLLVLVLNWWVMFRWNGELTWSFDKFLVLTVWTIAQYLLTVFLYPPDLSQEEEHRARFENNRMEFYLTFIAVCLLDIAQTGLRGELLRPIWYLPFVSQYAGLAAGGLLARRRGYDRFFAWYLLITALLWSLVVRRYLAGDEMVSATNTP